MLLWIALFAIVTVIGGFAIAKAYSRLPSFPRLSEMAEALGDSRRSAWALEQLCRRGQADLLIEALLAPPVIARDSFPTYHRMTCWDQNLARHRAAEGLGRLRAPEAVRPLLTVLAAAPHSLRVRIVWALGMIGSSRADAATALVPWLGDDAHVAGVFQECCSVSCPPGVNNLGELTEWSLRGMGAAELVDVFTATLQGDSHARHALRSLDSAAVRSALIRALHHLNPVFAANAALTLAELRATEALPSLRSRLRLIEAASQLVRSSFERSIADLERHRSLPRAVAAPALSTATLPRAATWQRRYDRTLPRAVGR